MILKKLLALQLEYEEMPFIVKRPIKKQKVRREEQEPNENVIKEEHE